MIEKLNNNLNFKNSQNYVIGEKQKVRLYLTLFNTVKKKVGRSLKTIYKYNINEGVILFNEVNNIEYKIYKNYLRNYIAVFNFSIFILAFNSMFEELKALLIFICIFFIFFTLWLILNKIFIKYFFYKQYNYLYDRDKFYYYISKKYYDIIFEKFIVKQVIKISFIVLSLIIITMIYLYFLNEGQEYIFYSYCPMLFLGGLYIFRKIK